MRTPSTLAIGCCLAAVSSLAPAAGENGKGVVRPRATTIGLPVNVLDSLPKDGDLKQHISVARARHRRLREFAEQRRDWGDRVVEILNEYVRARGALFWTSPKKADVSRKAKMQLQVDTALAVARLLRLREAVPGLKAVIRVAAEDNTYLREAMQALHSIGIEDDYWVACLRAKSKNGRDYVACAALCEVWNSPSKTIQASIVALQKEIRSKKDVNLGIGLPAAFQWVRVMKSLDMECRKSSTQKRLRLAEAALRKCPRGLSGSWHREYEGRIGDDYKYVLVRWGAERLRELSRKHPDDVTKYIVALPNRHAEEPHIKDEELPAYRTYLLQWVTVKVREAVLKATEAGKGSK